MRATTTTGCEVFALQRIQDPKTLLPMWSGKIRMVANNPHYDQYFHWHRNGKAIGHEMGDLPGEIYG